MDFWYLFNGMEWWKISLFLALIALGIAIPLRVVLSITGFSRRMKAGYYVFINPVVEEVIFRLGLLGLTVILFGPLMGILATTLLYMIYMGFVYGPPHVADALILGVFFSFAFFEFGFIIIVLAHIFYRFIVLVW